MIKKISILLILLSVLTEFSFSQITGNTEKLRNIIREKGQVVVSIPYPGKADIDRLTRNVSIRGVKNKTVFIVLSPVTAEWFLSQGYHYSIIERADIKGITTAENFKQAMLWESYPTYTQYDSIMRFFSSDYPKLCRLDTIGTSIEGRLVMALKIGSNAFSSGIKPKVFFTSSMHGDETAGFVIMLRLCESLLKDYYTDSKTKFLLDNIELWINPLANPDGTYKSGNSIISPTRGNANGYDLNRNFPDPLTPFTIRQKETLDMMKFLSRNRFSLSANFHSGTEVVNYPWDRWERAHADNNWFYGISRSYADTAHIYSPKGYMTYFYDGVTNGYDWYPVYGGRQDYVTYSLGGREVTVELDTNFVSASADLPVLWESNRRSLKGYIENALYGIHGTITDSNTGKPVPAKVEIAGHDMDNSYVYSDTMTSNFVRLIEPGSWSLNLSADRYRDTTINNVAVSQGETTFLDLEMEPVINLPDTLKPEKPFLFPNPAVNFLNAVLPVKMRSRMNIKIINLAGSVISDYNMDATSLTSVLIDVRKLSPGSYVMVFTNRLNNLSEICKFNVSR